MGAPSAFTYGIIAVLVGLATLSLLIGLRRARQNRIMAWELLTTGLATTTMPKPRELEALNPWTHRVLKPMLRRLYGIGRRLTPAHHMERLQHLLIIAGQPGELSVTDFLGLRFLVAITLAVIAFLYAGAMLSLVQALLMAGGGFGVGLYLPNFWLRRRARARQAAIARQLPDILDMLSICVDAGLGFESALQKVTMHWNNDLSTELQRVLSETRLGVRRIDALHHLVERTAVPEVASFVAVLVQADRLGMSIRDVLHAQSLQMRIYRRLRLEEEARKLPLKLLFPLIFFIFPAMFAVVLGPAIPKVMEMFGNF
jgi:tight adherence protein C